MDVEKVQAGNAFEAVKNAVENYLRTAHDDGTIVLDGLIFQASGSGVDGEVLAYGCVGTKTETIGLLGLLTARVESAAYKHIYDEEDDDE